MLVVIFGLLFLMMNRNRKQQREAAELRNSIEVGDEVMTGAGMYGTVTSVDGQVITIESTPGVASRWFRPAIAKKVDPAVEYATDDDAVPAAAADSITPDSPSEAETSASASDASAGSSEGGSSSSGTTTNDGFLSQDQLRRPYRDDKK